MELLMPVLLIFIIGGFFLYNPLRRKFKGIIGVGGSYLLATGLMVLIGLIAAIFSKEARASMDGGVAGLILYIVIALAAVAYLAFIMLTRCQTVGQRIALPFVVLVIAFGFATRLLASIFLHLPMEGGKEDGGEASFPEFIYDQDGNPWQLLNKGTDNANYYCQKTGETKMFYSSDFDEGFSPSGFHR